MSNIITPLTNIDFAACVEEIKSHLELRIVALPSPKPWSDIYYFMVRGEHLPKTANTLAELNLSILNILYIETQGGNEYYQGTTPNSYIIFPLEETESTLSAYSAPIGSAGIPDDPNGYNAEDCTLLENYSLSEPLFVKCVLDDAEPVYYYQIPEGEVFKSIIVFVNEDTL